jgi:phage recombination protein Bet
MRMTTALAKVETGPWTEADIALIKQTVAKGATDSEFKLFLYTAIKYDLDPLIKQIWCVKYGDRPAAIYAARDGFLAIAHRSGQFDGMETDAIRDDNGRLISAICRVWRKDMSHPFVVEVPFSEYDQSVAPNSGNKPNNWNKFPSTMLKKVAESQCLRRAFNISGIYEPSEFDPATDESATPKLPPAGNGPATATQQAERADPTDGFFNAIPACETLAELQAIGERIKLAGYEKGDPRRKELLELYTAKKDLLERAVAAGPHPAPPVGMVETVQAEPLEVASWQADRTCPKCDGPMKEIGFFFVCQARGCGHSINV